MTALSAGLKDQLEKLSPQQRKRLLKTFLPRLVPQYMPIAPHPKQQLLMTLTDREVLFGGSAGPGKTSAILLAALQYVDVPGYSALVLRRTWSDLNGPGGPMDVMRKWLANTDAVSHEGGRYFTFPSGARLSFGYLQRENDKLRYQGHEYSAIFFDELSQFGLTQYEYLFSRLRKPQLPCMSCGGPVRNYPRGPFGQYDQWKHLNPKISKDCTNIFPDPMMVERYKPAVDGLSIWDVPLRQWSTSNPGGPGHQWVRERFIDPKTRRKDTKFLPANLMDNPFLSHDEYIQSLSHLGALERERLLNGNWDAHQEGTMFRREWFIGVPDAPDKDIPRLRYWDMAASEGQGDYTVGTLVSLDDGVFTIEHQIRGQWGPYETQRIVLHTAEMDGPDVSIRMEQEPGASGKILIDHYRRLLPGYKFDGDRVTGPKTARAMPFAAAAEHGLVHIVLGPWNRRFLDELELFPEGQHDDQTDSFAGACTCLAHGKRQARLIV